MKLPRVYVINLDRSPDRLKDFMQSFEPLELDILRVAAVDGKELTLPHPDYNENNYRRFHGQRTSMGAVGCYPKFDNWVSFEKIKKFFWSEFADIFAFCPLKCH